ncbi:hypothetical protein ACEPAI_1465 [Sanghuangporus weigelae]
MPISYLAVVGSPNASGAVFHFQLSFVSQNPNGNKESVRIDMQRSYIDRDTSMRAIALVEYNPYEYSQRFGPEPFLVPVAPGITAAMLLEMIFNQSHMDRYIFVHPGQGCRHWCASVLDMLAQRRVVDAQVPQWFANYEVVQHTIFGGMFPMPRIRDTFYL